MSGVIGLLKRFLYPSDEQHKADSDTLTMTTRAEFSKTYDPKNEHDRMGLALLVTMQKQLDLLGFELSKVPAVTPFVSPKCRGALAGISIGLLEAENVVVTKDSLIDTTIAAFALIFGDEIGRTLAMQTADDIVRQNVDVMEASEWARADVKGVYESGGATSAVGFYVASQGMI